jgi:hypothetical protein
MAKLSTLISAWRAEKKAAGEKVSETSGAASVAKRAASKIDPKNRSELTHEILDRSGRPGVQSPQTPDRDPIQPSQPVQTQSAPTVRNDYVPPTPAQDSSQGVTTSISVPNPRDTIEEQVERLAEETKEGLDELDGEVDRIRNEVRRIDATTTGAIRTVQRLRLQEQENRLTARLRAVNQPRSTDGRFVTRSWADMNPDKVLQRRDDDDSGDSSSGIKKGVLGLASAWGIKRLLSKIGLGTIARTLGRFAGPLGLAVTAGTALHESAEGDKFRDDLQYSEDVKKYGEEKAKALRDVRNRSTSPTALFSRLKDSIFGSGEEGDKKSRKDDAVPTQDDVRINTLAELSLKAKKLVIDIEDLELKGNAAKLFGIQDDDGRRPRAKTRPVVNDPKTVQRHAVDDDNVRKYGVDKAQALAESNDRATSLGGLSGRLGNLLEGNGFVGESERDGPRARARAGTLPSTSSRGSVEESSGSGSGTRSYGTLAEQRKGFGEQLKDPELKKTLAALMLAEEGGDSKSRMRLAETVMNRAASRGVKDLRKIIDPNYYAPFKDGGFQRAMARLDKDPQLLKRIYDEQEQVLRGSDYSNLATDNASGSVKANALRRGDTLASEGDNKEGFIRKDKNPGVHGAKVVDDTNRWLHQTRAAMEAERKRSEEASGKDTPEKVSSGNVVERQAQLASIRKGSIQEKLKDQLDYAASRSGVKVEVFSGGQDPNGRRTGSHRHDHGGAADLKLYREVDGKKQYLNMSDRGDREIMQKFVRNAVRAGANGVGAAEDYMGPESIHVGGGREAVWGAGGHGSNATEWMREAFNRGLQDRKDDPIDLESWKKERDEKLAQLRQPTPVDKPSEPKIEPRQEAAEKPPAPDTPKKSEPEKSPTEKSSSDGQKRVAGPDDSHERRHSTEHLRHPVNHPESEAPRPGSDGYGDKAQNPDGGICFV